MIHETLDQFVNRRVKEILGDNWIWRDVSAKQAAALQAEKEYAEGRLVRKKNFYHVHFVEMEKHLNRQVQCSNCGACLAGKNSMDIWQQRPNSDALNPVDVIQFAITIDDHYDRLEFLIA